MLVQPECRVFTPDPELLASMPLSYKEHYSGTTGTL